MIEIKSETLRTDTMMAMEFGRMESTLAAAERWYKLYVEQHRGYIRDIEEISPLGAILGVERLDTTAEKSGEGTDGESA